MAANTKLNKIGALVGLIGGSLGILSTALTGYLTYKEFQYRKPIDERAAMYESYQGEIKSAQARGDTARATALRREYEKFENGWRAVIRTSELVPGLVRQPITKIARDQREYVRSLLTTIEASQTESQLPKRTIGDAWLVAGDYQKARASYQAAIMENGKDPENYLSIARASAYLAGETADPQEKEQLQKAIEQNLNTAKALQPKDGSWLLFDPIMTTAVINPAPKEK